MDNTAKVFGIYCSGGASRVLLFYSHKKNVLTLRPKKVIYDGNRDDIIQKLTSIFGDDLLSIDSNFEPANNNLHSLTSSFIYKALKKYDIEYLLCFGNKILGRKLVMEYREKLINFHPSLLPSFKGLRAIDQALESTTSFLGNTAHFIDEDIDTGSIIIQSLMLQSEYEAYEDVLELQFPMIKLILRDLLNYRIPNTEILSELLNRKQRFLIPEKCSVS